MGAKPELREPEPPTPTRTSGDTESDNRAPAAAWVSETQESRCADEFLFRRTAGPPSGIHRTANGDATKRRAQDCGGISESNRLFRTKTRVARSGAVARAGIASKQNSTGSFLPV